MDIQEAPISITVVFSKARNRRFIKATTWGIVAGRYGSLGVVEIPVERMNPPTTRKELADLLLTALYGLDYDL